MNGNGSGPLRSILETATTEGYSLKELTVLSAQIDPYRFDTPAGHRNGQWFAEQVERLLRGGQTVHLRGLHYRLVAVGNGLRPPSEQAQALPYTNTEEAWTFLSDVAAKAARWLGYVPFERIVDERNAPAELFVPSVLHPWVRLFSGGSIDIPECPSETTAIPYFSCGEFGVPQPYRIILIGEKVSLRPVLRPLAEQYGTELLLPTGEISDTQIAELANRCATDGRPAVVLYFSDFDPSGHQMPISVARKLQALRDLCYPDLHIEVHPIALTLEQVRRLRLPSTPLKSTEQRADHWRTVMRHEQTEIDALAALNPRALSRIAEDAIKLFYDDTLRRRVILAEVEWRQEAEGRVQEHPAYAEAANTIRANLQACAAALSQLERVRADLSAAQEAAARALADIEPPEVVLPEPQLAEDLPEPLFTTAEDYVTATRRLIAHKRLNL